MIVSHAHKFIFMHNRKTAGSSIAVSLARYLGPDDLQFSALIETADHGIPITARTLREARRKSLYTLPIISLAGGRAAARATTTLICAAYRHRLGAKPAHAPAYRVANAFPLEWASYKRFCVVRNPWDKTVSDYYWRPKACPARRRSTPM